MLVVYWIEFIQRVVHLCLLFEFVDVHLFEVLVEAHWHRGVWNILNLWNSLFFLFLFVQRSLIVYCVSWNHLDLVIGLLGFSLRFQFHLFLFNILFTNLVVFVEAHDVLDGLVGFVFVCVLRNACSLNNGLVLLVWLLSRGINAVLGNLFDWLHKTVNVNLIFLSYVVLLVLLCLFLAFLGRICIGPIIFGFRLLFLLDRLSLRNLL